MKRTLLSLLIAVASTIAFAQSSEPIIIGNVTIIDVAGGPPQLHRTVIVRNGKIDEIHYSDQRVGKTKGVQVNGTGKFLIPGLWDMHVHIAFGDWFPLARQITLPLFIANGIIGVRDMGSDLEVLQEWRKEISAGTLLCPRIVMAGPMLDGPQPRFPSSIAIKTPDDGRRAVDDLKRRGVDFIKLQSLLPRDAVFAIADESKKQAIPFVGHVPDSVRASEMSNAGQKSFEHLIGIFEGASPLEDKFLVGPKSESQFLSTYDPQRAAALFKLLAKNQTWQCPTLVWERGGNLIELSDFAHDPRAKYVPSYWKDVTWKRFADQVIHEFNTDDLSIRRRFVDKELEVVKAMYDAGVPLLAGTDTASGVYIFPGFSLHEELQRFVAAGLTPLQALQTATLNPAKFFSMDDRLGTIEKGKLADMVLLDENPLDDIRNTQKIAAVIVNGRYFSRSDLDKILSGVEAAAKTK